MSLNLKYDYRKRQLKRRKGLDPAEIEGNWRDWLRTVGPRTFTGSFAPFHVEFWSWFWRLIAKRRMGHAISDEEQAFLAIWARGMGKSANVEWAAIAEGALIGKGYVLYVSGTQNLADGHVQSIRERLESDEITRYYPHLGQPKVGKHGNQFGWRQDFLITSGGWAIRPIGLDVGVRGGRVGDLRPTLIIFDDVDDHSDSPLVVQNKLETIARSIIPAGTANTVILGAQNLIHRNSVFNQIVTRKTTLLSRRIVSGPHPAFEGLEIERRQLDDGPHDVIVKGSPTWKDFDVTACQKFLDDTTKEAFLAEYQHDFKASEQGRVIPEYDEAKHVITWSDFERVFGVRRIPQHWLCECGHDVGFTSGHLSAWTWIATSAQNAPMPAVRFRYRGCTFNGIGVDEQAEHVKQIIWPGENVQVWRMSHEALSERKTYREKYGFPFKACNSAKTAGLSQWNHFLQADRKKPHPFHEDVIGEDGLYALGFPSWFDIVDDDQLISPRDDRGLVVHRRQALEWRYRPDVLGVGGMSKNEPMKADEDSCFVAGTMIRTAAGEKPIEEVRINDLVWTRKGLRRVIAAGLTNPAARVLRIATSNGVELIGTGNHLIWTEKDGFCRLDSTRMASMVSVWQSTKLSSLMEFGFTAIQSLSARPIGTILSRIITPQQKASSLYMWKSGRKSMVRFLQASKSTIKTAIRLTMNLRTWNVFLQASTSATMRHALALSASSEDLKHYLPRNPWPQNGTEARKAGSGIQTTPKKRWQADRCSLDGASTAANRSKQSSLLSGFARHAASNVRKMAARIRLKFEHVRPAAKTSKPLFALVAFTAAVNARIVKVSNRLIYRIEQLAKTAVATSKRLVQPATAHESVKSVLLQPATAAVYNLSVEDVPEYFANGILVHNCDSTRMITANWGPQAAALTEAEQIENLIPEGWRVNEGPDSKGWQREGWEIGRAWKLGEAKEQFKKQHRNLDDTFEPASPLAGTNDDPFGE